MNAFRLTMFATVFLALPLIAARAQESKPEDAADQPQPAEPQSEAPEGIPGFGMPGQTGAPTEQPDLPNLQAPPPGAEPLGMPPGASRRQASGNPLLTLFDTDGDGILSGDEVEEAPARLWELDRNLDAELSADELSLIQAPRWEERRRGVPGHRPAESMEPAPEEPETAENPRREARPRFQAYPLRGLDPGRTLGMLQQVLEDHPDARLTYDGRTRSILALAPPSAHAKIREALAGLLEGERTGMPGLAPGMEQPAAEEAALPVVPRPVPLYNAQPREVLRIIRQVYRDRIVEPAEEPAEADPRFPGERLPPIMDEPVVPEGKMVIGEGAEPGTIVISAEDELFFEVLDLVEELDAGEGLPREEMEAPPKQ